ncbi:MAG: hypothetical protein Kow00107_09850 [Planctomycetota bacterium]
MVQSMSSRGKERTGAKGAINKCLHGKTLRSAEQGQNSEEQHEPNGVAVRHLAFEILDDPHSDGGYRADEQQL